MEQETDKILCPYCGKSQGMLVSAKDIDSFKKVSTCRECARPFVLEGYAYWRYTTKKIEGEE